MSRPSIAGPPPIVSGGNPRDALRTTIDLARQAERT